MAGLITTTYEEPKKKAGLQNTIGNPAAVSAGQTMPITNSVNTPSAQPLSTGVAAPVNNAVAIKYLDPQGNYVQGYSINGKTYKDAAGTQRIEEGSIVPNQAGTQAWILQNGVGVPIANYQPGPSAAITNAYNRSVQAANKRLEANIAQIEANRPKINDAYDQLARQNYQGYMQSQEALANQLASQGLYNSGYSDTAKVAQNVGYRSVQSETERARLQALADLETEINVARLNGSANLAELEAEYAILQNEQANYEREFVYNAAQQLLDRQYQQNRDAVADEWRRKEWDYQVDRDKVYDERYQSEIATEDAWRRAEYGDFSGLKEIGIDPTVYQEAYNKEQQRADEEWEMFVEDHKSQMAQYASAEEQRLYENAVEQANYGNFEPLRNLGFNTAAWEAAYAKNRELANLEVQAAYQDIAIRDQQIALNNRTLTEQEEDEANALVDFDALYKKDPGKYNEVISLAKQFAENLAGRSNKTLSEQFLTAYSVAKNYYGEEYAELWREAALAAIQPEPTGYETFDESMIEQWQDRIFGDTTKYTYDDSGADRVKTSETKSREVVNRVAQENAAWQLLEYYAAGAITWSEVVNYGDSIGLGAKEMDELYNSYNSKKEKPDG